MVPAGVTSSSRSTSAASRRCRPKFSIDPPFGTGCIVGQDTIPVGFSVTRTIDSAQVGAPLSISVKDIDFISDDTIDVSPVPGVNSLQLAVDPFTGTFAPVDASGSPQPGISFPGGVSAAQLSGNGDSDRAGLNMRIVSSAGPDSDGDGLLDSWETSGFDADGNGTIDVNLPAMGANPRHKDLFVELDTANGRTLGREDIKAMKDTFAAAPRTNPDGVNGITLHVDTGTAVDPTAREGQPLGTCNDGIDNRGDGVADAADGDCSAVLGSSGNDYLDASVEDPLPPNCQNGVDDDGDGLPDATDPDCLAGDNLGGGNAITTAPAICNLNAAFYTTKLANFDPNRLPIFRYAISTPGSTGCGSGGQAEIGGNDFVDHNGDGGTIMHEMGHTLALRHGGFEDLNCKPNLVSVMSYFSQFGVGKNGGGAILDYSPPRQGVTGGARSSALPASVLDEASLSETAAVDGSDPANRFVFTNGAGTRRWVPLNGQTDWDAQRHDHARTGRGEHRQRGLDRQPERVHQHHNEREAARRRRVEPGQHPVPPERRQRQRRDQPDNRARADAAGTADALRHIDHDGCRCQRERDARAGRGGHDCHRDRIGDQPRHRAGRRDDALVLEGRAAHADRPARELHRDEHGCDVRDRFARGRSHGNRRGSVSRGRRCRLQRGCADHRARERLGDPRRTREQPRRRHDVGRRCTSSRWPTCGSTH